MTIDVDFFSKGRIVLRVNMCASSFCSKLCAGISNEELNAVVPETKSRLRRRDFRNILIHSEEWFSTALQKHTNGQTL
jgi:hypothetical protein